MEYDATGAVAGDRLSDAADLFGKAWEIFKRADSICNRGSVLLKMGRYREAAESLEICRRASPESNGAMNQVVKHTLDKARAEIGTITVTTNVPGAQILVDNKLVGTAPLEGPVFVELGRHVVEARAEGYATDARLIASSKGSWREVGLRLEPPMKPGLVMQEPTPLPEEGPQSAATKPRIALSSADFGRASSVGPSASTTHDPSAQPNNQSLNTILLVSGLGAVVLGASVGIGGLVTAAGRREEATALREAVAQSSTDRKCTAPLVDIRCLSAKTLEADASTMTFMSVTSFVFSAGGGAIAAYGIAQMTSSASPKVPRVAFGATPAGAAVFVAGSF